MFNRRSSSYRGARWAAGLGLAMVMPFSIAVQAQEGAPDYLHATQRWLDEAGSNIRPSESIPLRMEVVLGELDRRLQLAPCARVEPYIPVGTQLWGKTRLGLRCLEGASKWNVFLPITIRAYGSAWVLKSHILPGTVLTEDDAIEAEVDWAEERTPVVANPSQWVGQVATRTLPAGQALRAGMTRAAQVFQSGSQVRVIAQGAGFQITSAGQAMSAGIVGQSARVKMDNGRVLSGVVVDSRTVRLDI
jgi:flagellar basal body P-ring formation protein FlgA